MKERRGKENNSASRNIKDKFDIGVVLWVTFIYNYSTNLLLPLPKSTIISRNEISLIIEVL